MYGSLKIGTVFGIPIRLHWSFFLLLPFIWREPISIPVVFGSVLLHELGHSLMARRFGINVLDITFWPLGGMARMSNLPERAGVEALVAIAGPLVNFVLAGLTLGVAALAMLFLGGQSDLVATLGPAGSIFVLINLALGTFNLLPAFPMDGGRILRAFFARRNDWVSATEKAVKVARIVAVGMVALPLAATVIYPPIAQLSCTMCIIALYLYFVGTQELMAVRVRHGHSPFGGRRGAAANDPLGGAGGAEPEWTVGPAPERDDPPPVPGEAQRPTAWDGPQTSRGFDEERVRELERFRGRLRRYRDEE